MHADEKNSLLKDMKMILFFPNLFFSKRFLALWPRRIFALAYIGLFLGLFLANLLGLGFSIFLEKSLLIDPSPYQTALNTLGLTTEEFKQLLLVQRAFTMLGLVLCPIITYMLPHLFAGAFFAFLWLFNKEQTKKMVFSRVIECAAISLTPMFFYAVPIIGPIIAIVLIAMAFSRALLVEYKLFGISKSFSIIGAIYICFFLGHASLQLLAQPLSLMLK